jgi:hypothetical protein
MKIVICLSGQVVANPEESNTYRMSYALVMRYNNESRWCAKKVTRAEEAEEAEACRYS